VYIDTGSPVPNIPSKSRGLADEYNKRLTECKWFEATVLACVLGGCCFYHFVLNFEYTELKLTTENRDI
jgi:hypothetical protein